YIIHRSYAAKKKIRVLRRGTSLKRYQMLGRVSRLCLLTLAVLLASCGQASAPAGTAQSPAAGNVEPVFAFSEAIAGKNRIAIGLVQNNTPLNEPKAKVHLRFFNLDASNPQQVVAETDATYYGQGLPAAFYVAYPNFDKPGNWGVEIQTQLPGQAQPS